MVNDLAIPYEIIRSRRKSYGISVSPGGKVTVRIPLRGSERFALSMMEEKREWIAKNYIKMKEVTPLPSQKEKTPYERRLEAPYRQAAKEYIPKRVAYYASLLGVDYATISIRDQKTRWGSCSSKGNLSFSWRLILAPPKVLDYVVVHELCHRKEMNHSGRFWALVQSMIPDYQIHRKWLKDYGNTLTLTSSPSPVQKPEP